MCINAMFLKRISRDEANFCSASLYQTQINGCRLPAHDAGRMVGMEREAAGSTADVLLLLAGPCFDF